jgi:hypothetical protein
MEDRDRVRVRGEGWETATRSTDPAPRDSPPLGLLASLGILTLVALAAIALSFLLPVMILIFGSISW